MPDEKPKVEKPKVEKPKPDAPPAAVPPGATVRTTNTTERTVIPPPTPVNGVGRSESAVPSPRRDGLLSPWIPSLGQPDSMASQPAYMRIYRCSPNDYRNRTPQGGRFSLRATLEEIIAGADHGHGGHYIFQAYYGNGDICSGPVGELDLDSDPVEYAKYQRSREDEARRIQDGAPQADAAVKAEIAELRRTIAEAQSKALNPSQGSAISPELAGVLQSLAEGQRAIAQALQRDPLADLERFSNVFRNLQPPMPAVPTASTSTAEVVGLALKISELSGKGREPSENAERIATIKEIGSLIDNLTPKVAGAFTGIIEEIKKPSKSVPSPESPASSTTPPSSPNPSATASPTQTESDEEKEMNEKVKVLLAELDQKLRDPGYTAAQIAADVRAGLASGKVPAMVKSFLSLISDSNLDSQLTALGKPEWGTQPIRAKFLAACAALK